MSVSKSYLSYTDCFSLFEAAIADDLGLRVAVPDQNQAMLLRTRLHMARKLDRDKNADVYEPGEKMHNCSIFDPIAVRIKRDRTGQVWVYLEKIEISAENIQALSQVTEEVMDTITTRVREPSTEEMLGWKRESITRRV